MNDETVPSSTGSRTITHQVVSHIESGMGPDGCDIYIGGTAAARDIALLREHNISTVVNCAVNLDINYVFDPVERAEGEKCAHGVGPIRIFKIGLVDGQGNSEDMMLASYLLLDGAIRQVIPDKITYPRRAKGNVPRTLPRRAKPVDGACSPLPAFKPSGQIPNSKFCAGTCQGKARPAPG